MSALVASRALRWQVGEVTITSIVEQGLQDIESLIPAATPELLARAGWLKPDFVGDDGRMRGVIQAFVLETPDKLIVVDCCVGDDKDRPVLQGHGWHRRQHGFLVRLADAGYARERVDVVLCTHLHVDHVGWNTMRAADRWVPTFPHARYLFARREFEHLQQELAQSPALARMGLAPQTLLAALAEPARSVELMAALMASHGLSFEQLIHGALDLTSRQAWLDSIAPVVDAGLADLVDDHHDVCAQVMLVPTNGHTPGHVSVRVRSGGAEALITGDAIHHPVQLAAPELSTVADADPAGAVRTRREMLAAIAGGPTLLIGTHFAPPTAGRVRADGAGYRLVCGDGACA